MKLYNSRTKKTEEHKFVMIDDLKYFVETTSNRKLNSIDLYRISRDTQPNKRYYESKEIKELRGDGYRITHESKERNVAIVQSLMIHDLKAIHNQYELQLEIDTGSGIIKVKDQDINVLVQRIKNNKLEIRDKKFKKIKLNKSQMEKLISDILDKKINLLDKRDKKLDEIMALTSIDECILYEKSPYSDNNTVKYRNKVKDWSQ